MTIRAIAFLTISLILGGCMQETLEPATEAGWTARDKQLMSNLPYAQATIPQEFQRHIVDYSRKEAPGTIVVDADNKFLSYVLPKGQAIRYGITVGEEAQAWSGIAKVGRMEEWPSWTPTAGEHARLDPLPAFVTGGPANPMGARGLYLYSGNKDTQYRIHGTNQPEYIGQAISSGCIRMTNEDVIDLYNRVKMGTIVVVLAPTKFPGIWSTSPVGHNT
jgi:lipoprotein-anchoring transpeptidase ErfK/SrfK